MEDTYQDRWRRHGRISYSGGVSAESLMRLWRILEWP
jgi:hypothetical protein